MKNLLIAVTCLTGVMLVNAWTPDETYRYYGAYMTRSAAAGKDGSFVAPTFTYNAFPQPMYAPLFVDESSYEEGTQGTGGQY